VHYIVSCTLGTRTSHSLDFKLTGPRRDKPQVNLPQFCILGKTPILLWNLCVPVAPEEKRGLILRRN